jgi:hypothetical protein
MTAAGQQSSGDSDRRGARPDEAVKGKGKSKDHDTKGNDGDRYYLLVDPRPGRPLTTMTAQ